MITMMVASAGTATSRPTTPSSSAITSTLKIERTGGMCTCRSMISGATKLASIRCTASPSSSTRNACHGPPAPRTKAAGSSVETRVPKKGTIATSPVNTPNASA